MPKYLISYRKVEGAGQKPDWASFTAQSDASLEAHAIKERVEKRMSVLGEQLWGDGDVVWIGPNERHWHGAAEDSYMIHMATSIGKTTWSPTRVFPS